jgi:rhodanese-related sulfurtransferase
MNSSRPTDNFVSFLEAKLATELGPHEARELVEEGKATFLDVRSVDSYQEGHVPDCLHIPRRELDKNLTKVPKNTIIVTYCSDLGCQASLKAAIELRRHGYDARHMVGGFRFYKEKGYPVQTTKTPMIAARPKE